MENDQPNDTSCYNYKVLIDDKTNDNPNYNTDVLKENMSTAAEEPVASFPNQGMHAMSKWFLLWPALFVFLYLPIT